MRAERSGRGNRPSRLVEWGKTLLIILLALSALCQLSRTPPIENLWRALAQRPQADPSPSAGQSAAAAILPVRLAIYRDGQRFGLQYDGAAADAAFSSLTTLLSEALGSASEPRAISEREWRAALARTGIYLDFFYPVPLPILSDWLGDGQPNSALTGSARRVCLAAGGDDGVSLFYINEEDGSYYACGTTLSRGFHLDTAVAGWTPNGALFAFEVPGMETLAPYTLLTSTPQPAVYAAANPLLEDSGRIQELLTALTFHPQGGASDPFAGPIVEGSDSLRLSRSGQVAFHAIGDSDFRFPLPEDSLQAALDCTQALAEATAGAWCGQARLCLAGVETTSDGLEITFQYFLNGSPVALPEDTAAARFLVRNGAVTDFSLCLRAYSGTEETSAVLPEALAAAAMEAEDAQGRELTLLYEDAGGELVYAGWGAV